MQPVVTHTSSERRRSWLIELLIVVGVLGFGYFAVTMETAPRAVATAEAATH